MKYPDTIRLAFFESEDGKCRLLLEQKDTKFTKWIRVTDWVDVTFIRLPVGEEIAAKLIAIEESEKRIQSEINRQTEELVRLRGIKNGLLPIIADNFVDIGDSPGDNEPRGVEKSPR